MLEYALTRLKHEVQPREIRVLRFEFVDDTQGLQVMLKAAEVAHAGIEGILTRMPEGRMPEIMCQADGLSQCFVEVQCNGDRAADLRDLERRGQSSAIQIALVINEYLRIVNQAAEGR